MQHTSAAMQQPAAAMQQSADKQQPLAAMQQPATTQQPQISMQQPAAMQPISSAESPIFKRNSSDESPTLEDTANNDNGHIDFNDNSSMPSIIDLATAGFRRSPCIAAKESEKKLYFIVQHNYEVFLCFWCGNGITVDPRGKLFVLSNSEARFCFSKYISLG